MILDKVLILKGLGGLTVLGGTATAAYFVFSNNDPTKKLKEDLGLPSDCNLPSSGFTTCTLDTDKLKAIKFDGKGEGNVTIPNNGTVTLTITKVDSTDSIFGKGGYKFAFNSAEDLSIPKTGSESISIKKGTNTEFRIKETTPSDGGAKTLSLEKAWNITEWGKKVGLTGCTATGDQKQCDFGGKINLFISASDKTEEGTIESGKKITFEEDQGGYNQGFKFTVSEDISLNSASNGDKKIENKSNAGNPSYEIKEIGGQWYLAKKTTNGVSG